MYHQFAIFQKSLEFQTSLHFTAVTSVESFTATFARNSVGVMYKFTRECFFAGVANNHQHCFTYAVVFHTPVYLATSVVSQKHQDIHQYFHLSFHRSTIVAPFCDLGHGADIHHLYSSVVTTSAGTGIQTHRKYVVWIGSLIPAYLCVGFYLGVSTS